MNAKNVLNKILTFLGEAKEVELTYAKLADGTILESPTFDLGEPVDVVSEDGTKTPAPDGEHEVVLKDSEGNDVRIKVETKDGKIVERENVEVETPAESEAVEMESIAGGDMGDDEEVATEETANPLPEDTDMKSVIEKLQYRIEELEKKYAEMADVKDISEGKKAEKVEAEPLAGDPGTGVVDPTVKMEAVDPSEEEVDEEELPKLDGAPIDENAQKPLGVKLGKSAKVGNYQSAVLSKLYK